MLDTITLSFRVKPECKKVLFDDFKDGFINGVRKKWRKIKVRKSKRRNLQLKVKKNSLFFYFKGYDRFYYSKYPFTGKYGDYNLNYCHCKYKDDYICIEVQHTVIARLNKEEIYNNVLMFLESIGIDLNLLEVERKLNRIDFKRDSECEYQPNDEKQAINSILSKSRDSYNGVYKEKLKKGIGIKYKPKSSYIELIVYDKEQERKDKLKHKQKSSHYELEIAKYKNVFRTELRLKNKRLYYNIKHTLKIDKILDKYYNEEVADECFKRYVEPIFYTEPFYRIDYALLAIQSDRRLTEKEAEKLCKLVIDINEKGYTKAKAEYNYCDDTFDKHINLLRSIGINPLTFDEDIDIAFLLNFTTKEVCRDFTLYDGEHEELKQKCYDEWGFLID